MATTEMKPLTLAMREALANAARHYINQREMTWRREDSQTPEMESYCRRVHGLRGTTRKGLEERGLLQAVPTTRADRGGAYARELTDAGRAAAEEAYNEANGPDAFGHDLMTGLAAAEAEEAKGDARVEDRRVRTEALAPILKRIKGEAPGMGNGHTNLADAAEQRWVRDGRYGEQGITVTLAEMERIVEMAREGKVS